MQELLFRQIPDYLVQGVATGQYKVYGGVIRHAHGTQAGQIAAHLIPIRSPFDLSSLSMLGPVNTSPLLLNQMRDMNALSQGLYQLASGSMMLARLNLSVTMVGFALLRDRVSKIDEGLKQLNYTSRRVLAIAERQEYGKLKYALTDLMRLPSITHADNRHLMLHSARQSLGELQHGYRLALENVEEQDEALVYEELFVLTAVSQARCSAELGEMGLAQHELDDAYAFWGDASRFILSEFLLGADPVRFLASEYVETVSTRELVDWMTYVTGDDVGYEHLDNLRRDGAANKSRLPKLPKSLTDLTTNRKRYDEEMVIPAVRKLTARDSVLAAHIDQYALLNANTTTLSDFHAYLTADPEADYVLLLPSLAG